MIIMSSAIIGTRKYGFGNKGQSFHLSMKKKKKKSLFNLKHQLLQTKQMG